MRQSLLVLPLLLCLVSYLPAVAEKGDDPAINVNSPGHSDKRLDQKVTYEAKRKPVSVIIADLSKMSGVVLYAGKSDSDWQSRDRKMNVFVKGQSLSSVLESMARVMQSTWTRSKTDPPTYRVYLDPRQIRDAEEQMRKVEEQRIKDRKALLQDIHAIAVGSGDADKGEYLQALKDSGAAEALDVLFGELPDAKDAFVNNQRIRIGSAVMSPRAQTALLQLANSVEKLSFHFNPSESLPSDLSLERSHLALVVESDSHEMLPTGRRTSSMGSMGLTGYRVGLGTVSVAYRPEPGNLDRAACANASLPLLGPESGFAKGMGPYLLKNLTSDSQSGESRRNINITAPPGSKPTLVPTGEAAVTHDADAALDVTIDCKGEPVKPGDRISSTLGVDEYLAAIPKSSDFSVVSDCISEAARVQPRNSKVPLTSVLKTLSESIYRYNWWRHGSILEFRDRDWYDKLSLMIPLFWIEKWRTTLLTTGALTLDDLADIALVAGDEGRFANLLQDDVLSKAQIQEPQNSPFLLFYATLDPDQRRKVFSKDGLSMAGLSEDQWQAFDKIMPCAREALADGSLTGQEHKEPSGRVQYWLKIAGAIPMDTVIGQPWYQDPSKTKPAADNLDSIVVMDKVEMTVGGSVSMMTPVEEAPK